MTYPQILFFDGLNARPLEVNVEMRSADLYVFESSQPEARPLVFGIDNCKVSETTERLYIYLPGNTGAYLSVDHAHHAYAFLRKTVFPAGKGLYKKPARIRVAGLVGILIAVLVLAYFLMSRIAPAIAMKMITAQQEIRIGDQLYQSLMAAQTIDTPATRLAGEFARRLQLSDDYPITITVVKADDINAFALPGGHIVVYSGIIEMMDDPAMLVALLGHESSHVNKRHSLRSILSGVGILLLQSVILGGFGDVAGTIISHAGDLEQLRYSRGLEREADELGMQRMLQNGVDPSGMEQLMLALQDSARDMPGMLSFLGTHPLTVERIEAARKFAAEHASAKQPMQPQLQDTWKRLKDIE